MKTLNSDYLRIDSELSADEIGVHVNGQDRAAAPKKRQRPTKAQPSLDQRFADLSLAQVRARRKALMAEESTVSYWRRLVQARIDLLTGHIKETADLSALSRILADSSSARVRVAHMTLLDPTDIPPIPDLVELWYDIEDPTVASDAALVKLQAAEAALSAFRREVHRQLDQFTGELIARYHQDPSLAAAALPSQRWPADSPVVSEVRSSA